MHSVCWDNNGEFLASVSQDSVKVWSLVSGECIHELSTNVNKFHSCVFHPSYSTLLVIGGYQVSSILFMSSQMWKSYLQVILLQSSHLMGTKMDGILMAEFVVPTN